jgi:hypothetical protein
MAIGIGQTAGVKATTQHAVIGMSAAGRSGRSEHREPSLPRVSKWPVGAVTESVVHA